MIIRKMMKNEEIYNIASNLIKEFPDIVELKMPVKVHFYFQKNMNLVLDMGKDIDKSRIEIIQKYGTFNDETQNYDFEPDNLEKAVSDINDLFSLEQEVKVHTFPLEWLDGVNLTASQVNAFTFMIDDLEEE